MTILNESGVPDVLSPLQAVSSLTERLPDALVVVVGTRAEAFLVQSFAGAYASGGGSRLDRRVVFVVLDPREPPEEGRVASSVVDAAGETGRRGTALVLLVAGRSAELLGVNAAFEARLAARRLRVPVKAVDPGASVSGCLCTDLEAGVVATLVDLCPGSSGGTEEFLPAPSKRRGLFGGLSRRERERPERTRPVVLLGALASPGAGRELAAELKTAGIEAAGNVPGDGVADLPAINEATVVAPADPYLSAATRTAEERGARLVRTLMPIGVDGTARFIQDVASAAGRESSQLIRAREVWKSLEHLRGRIRGKRIFFAGDTGLEVPLARFLSDAGAVVLEVGAPRLDRKALAAELQALGSDVDVVEYPDWRGQMERVDAARPDVVVASPGLYVPLVARGHLCRSSLDFLRSGIHGYGGARRILELFVRTFERAEALDSVNL